MDNVLIFATVIAPIIYALVQAVKLTFTLPKNYIPVISIAIGLLVGLLSNPFTDLDMGLRLWSGLLAGLSATGLFELVNPRDGKTKGGGK